MTAPALEAEIPDLTAWRRDMRATGKEWAIELYRAERPIGVALAVQARLMAVGTGPAQAHFAPWIVGGAGVDGASVGLRGRDANAVFWGAKKRTGWNALNTNSAPQFPGWVGDDWDVGVVGQGPLAINPAIAHEMPWILARYEHVIDDVTRKAFPQP